MKLIIDMDDTISQTTEAIRTLYQEQTGDYSTQDVFNYHWDCREICPKWSKEDLMNCFNEPRFFEVLKPFDNAIEVLKLLKSRGHEISVVTVHQLLGIYPKGLWIQKYLPFIDTVVYINNNYCMNKSMICGDVILDDHINNLVSVNCKYRVCYGEEKEYNVQWHGTRVKNWNEFLEYINTLKR